MSDINKAKVLVKEIQNLFLVKKFELIIKETKVAIKKFPNLSIFYNLMGLALSQLGRLDEAKHILQVGNKINPNDLSIINNLANVHKNKFEYGVAEKLYKFSILKKKDYVHAYVNYGNLKKDLNDFDEAINLYETALKFSKDIPEIYFSLATAYQSIGNFQKAEFFSKKTLLINKKITKADLLISRSRKYKKENDDHLKSMSEKINNENFSTIQKVDLLFALAKANEDLGKISSCFKFLKEGNELKRSTVKFDINSEKKIFLNIKNIFSTNNFNQLKKKIDESKNIIFILGMPRSGTTLTEQIISSHSKVYGSGELPYLSKILKDELSDELGLSTPKVKEMFSNNDIVFDISSKYFSYINNYKISEKWITDKAPLNFMWVGFIKILFPNAKIIHCKRNSKDNCVSLYKNVFDGNLNFCYTQKELGMYYNLYSDLMKFWESLLSNCFLTVNYEDLIQDTKNETKKILDYCELDWEEKCLSLSDNKTPIKTASVGQARNSIYSSSINSSSKYEDYLQELFNII